MIFMQIKARFNFYSETGKVPRPANGR